MDQQLLDKTKKIIKDSELNTETKAQLLSLMDFINYPEVKQRVLDILELERQVTDLEIQYLKDMNERFRNSDLYGYNKQGTVIPTNTRRKMETNNRENVNTSVNTPTPQPQSAENVPTPISPQPQNATYNTNGNAPNVVQPVVSGV